MKHQDSEISDFPDVAEVKGWTKPSATDTWGGVAMAVLFIVALGLLFYVIAV